MRRWICMAHVKPRPGNEDAQFGVGAYVNCLAMAKDSKNFAEAVTRSLNANGYDVVELEDVDLVDERLRGGAMSEEVIEMANGLREDGEVIYDSFWWYLKEGD